jgi:hypothetical protein
MQMVGTSLQLSASDLVGYLNCRHLTNLDRRVADGALKMPSVWDPLLEILWERGAIHERNYIGHLETISRCPRLPRRGFKSRLSRH